MGFKKETEGVMRQVALEEREACEKELDAKDEAFWDEVLAGVPETPLKNREQLKKDYKREMLKELDPEAENPVLDGFALIFDECGNVLTGEESAELKGEVKTVASKLAEGSLDPQMDPSVPLAESFQLSNRLQNLIQKMGNHYYNKKQFQEAKTIFRFLVEVNPLVKDYWISFGHCARALNDRQQATSAYLFAGMCGLDDPLPYLLAAHINVKDNKAEAKEFLQTAKRLLEAKNDTKSFQDEIHSLENQLH